VARRRRKRDAELLGSAGAERKRRAATVIEDVESSLATPTALLRSIADAMESLRWSAACAGRGGERQGGVCRRPQGGLTRKERPNRAFSPAVASLSPARHPKLDSTAAASGKRNVILA